MHYQMPTLLSPHPVRTEASKDDKLQVILQIWAGIDRMYRKLKMVVSSGRTSRSVARSKAMREILEPIGRARDFMEQMLFERKGSNLELANAHLKHLFGEDGCDLIANIRVHVAEAQQMLDGSQLGDDLRLSGCLRQCDAVEDILKSVFRLDAKLDDAHRRAQVKAAAADLSQEELHTMLFEIDEGDEPEAAIDKLFDAYTQQGEEVISGQAKDKLTELVATYVSDESKARAERLGRKSLALEPEQIVALGFVTQCLDLNGDGSITRKEAKHGFMQALNDIDPPSDVRRRTRELTLKMQRELAANL